MSADAPDSLRELLDRYERPLVRYALSFVSDLEAARDVVQETFIRLVRRRAESRDAAPASTQEYGSETDADFPDPDTARLVEHPAAMDARHTEAWLFTVCRNLAIDFQRKQSRIIYLAEAMECTADEPGPGAALEQKEAGESIFALLDQLSANQREVIRLKFQNDLSYKEIASITELSVTNVGFLLHTGLRKLRVLVAAKLGEEWPQPLRSAL
ncbi:MAG: sigma-70 family RNA polymerase sigma factor [Verrucomicrobiota bacterium]|nr:sigma-70 family RNA polymerase sigma factor [Verrucomicrobiota bacterium]